MRRMRRNISYLVVALTIADISYAMNENLEQKTINSLPRDVVGLGYFTLKDLPISFVNKTWYAGAQVIFSDFYQFQSTYQECKRSFCKDKSQRNAFDILRKLRESSKKLDNRSQEENSLLLNAFLTNNVDSIQNAINTPDWLLEAKLNKHPEILVQMTLLRIWDNIHPVIPAPLKSYNHALLKMIAPTEQLRDFFRNETELAAKCDFASELCERDIYYTREVCGEAFKFGSSCKWREAAALYEIVLKKDRNMRMSWLLQAAEAFFEVENWELSAELYELAFKIDPGLAACHYLKAAESNFSFKNWGRSAELYEIAFNKEQNLEAGHYVNAAANYVYLGKWQQAVDLYEIAFKKDPMLPVKVYLDAAYAYSYLDNKQRRTELYEMAVDKDKNLPAIYYALIADGYRFMKDFQRAAEFYEIALNKDPNLEEFNYTNAAFVYLKLNNWQRAFELYEIRLSKSPDLGAISYLNAGYVAAKIGRTDRATSSFIRFLDLLSDEKLMLYQDTLSIMQSVFEQEGVGGKYLDWVSNYEQSVD
jgi:tetratricopeptide (TPR) repeat protein